MRFPRAFWLKSWISRVSSSPIPPLRTAVGGVLVARTPAARPRFLSDQHPADNQADDHEDDEYFGNREAALDDRAVSAMDKERRML